MYSISELKDKVISGRELTDDEVYSLCDADSVELRAAAMEITRKMVEPVFDSCSIINGRSGRCREDCKWCAQSAHYKTNCDIYDLVDADECVHAARINHENGIKRFSVVTSGKAAKGEALTKICAMLSRIRCEVGINTCASLGLLGREELQQLWDSGTHRYHCNLETAPSMFPKLCTTHTIDDKLRTIAIAREIGFEICSGGIIGMGETHRQRAEFALTLRKVRPVSIPVNVLCPIKGTPLEDIPQISEDEILDTIAIFRFVHPRVQLRFAGGRARISREGQLTAMQIGINGSIVGDLLTTIGSTVAQDRKLTSEAGYEW